MDNVNSMEKMDKYREGIKELFKETVSDELYNKWADTFELESIDGNRVMITYDGDDIKTFKKECGEALKTCVNTLLWQGLKTVILKKSRYDTLSPKAKKNIRALKFFTIGMIFLCLATAVIVVLCSYIGNRSFRETFYSTSSIKVDSSVRVIQISDIHGASYGKDNEKLLRRVKALEPDIIICTGDIIDTLAEDADYAVALAGELSKLAPSYYVYGNNEVEEVYGFSFTEEELDGRFGYDGTVRDQNALAAMEDGFEQRLEAAGIKVLKNERDTVKIRTMNVDVYGVLNSNPSSFWSYSEDAFLDYVNSDKSNLKITAVHEPFIFEEFEPEFWGDLMVCGHTHGGVMRIPYIGPLYTREGGIFPERSNCFVYGRYDAAGKPLIVSSGLENMNILRINNQPELVVIDINKF